MNSVVRGLVVVGLLLVALAGQAAAQAQGEVARQLRVEWTPLTEEWTRPRLVGHVYNESTYRIGSVPARGRAYFSVPRPSGAESFRLTVESFVLIARERREETP